MNQKKRLWIGLAVLVLLVVIFLGADLLRRNTIYLPVSVSVTLEPGDIPIYISESLQAAFAPADLEKLTKVSFTDPAENKLQEGWLLRDVLLLNFDSDLLRPQTTVTIFSSSREKQIQLTWSEISDEANWVMFDLSNRGTLKLVSKMEKLDTREEWIQDVDKIVINP